MSEEISPPQPGNPAGWSYSDYLLQPTMSKTRQRLMNHIQEVSDRLAGFQSRQGPEGLGGYSRFASLADYLKNLKTELDALDKQAGRGRRAAFIGLR